MRKSVWPFSTYDFESQGQGEGLSGNKFFHYSKQLLLLRHSHLEDSTNMHFFSLDFYSDAVISENNIITERNPILLTTQGHRYLVFKWNTPVGFIQFCLESFLQNLKIFLNSRLWKILHVAAHNLLTCALWFQTETWKMATGNTCTIPS